MSLIKKESLSLLRSVYVEDCEVCREILNVLTKVSLYSTCNTYECKSTHTILYGIDYVHILTWLVCYEEVDEEARIAYEYLKELKEKITEMYGKDNEVDTVLFIKKSNRA